MRVTAQRLLAVVLATLLLWESPAAATPLRWRIDLEAPVRFVKVLSGEVVLAGTERHLFALAHSDGSPLWRLRNVSVHPDQVRRVPGTSLLLVNEGWGGKFQDRQSSLLAVDSRTGSIVWESPTIKRQILEVAADPEAGRLLLVAARQPHGEGKEKRRLSLFLLDSSTGVIQWREDPEAKVRLSPRPRRRGERGDERAYDLAAYRQPAFDGDRLFTFYDGVRCYDAASGRLVWRQKKKLIEDDLALSYAEPFLEGGVLYLAAKGRVRAFDAATGARLWQSKDFGVITQLYLDEERIYARLGGSFLDFNGEDWRRRGPFGVVVLERRSGKKLWKWGGADDGITNLLIFGDRIYLADEKRLVALDRYTGKRLYRRGHDFEKPPLFIGLTEQDRLVLTGPEDAGAFRYQDGRRDWHHHLPAPGVGLWKKLAAGLLGTTGVLLGVASFGFALEQNLLPAVPSPLNRFVGFRGRVRRLTREAVFGLIRGSGDLLYKGDFARLEGHYQYYFTKLPEGGKGLVGVNLNTGRLQHRLRLRESDDRLAIDEFSALVFDPEGSRVTAYELGRGEAPRLR